MKKRDYFICAVLFILALASRIPLSESFQSHWDGPQYSIALINYSFEQQTPAPPGYPLYIALGKLLILFTHEPHKAMLLVSALSSGVAVLALYLVGQKLYHRQVGLIAASIYLTGSTFYYFGLTPYAYGLLPITTTILAYTVYQIYLKKRHYGLLLGMVSGIAFGIRPQETLQIGPLMLLGFFFLSWRQRIYAVLIFSGITLLWFLPLVHFMGLANYIKLSQQFAQGAFGTTSAPQHAELMVKGFLLSFGLASFFLLYFLFRRPFAKKETLFYLVWIFPGIIFNLFIRSDHAGYQMSYLSGFLILISYAIWQATKKSKLLFFATVMIIATFNLYWFFYDRDPSYTKPYRPTSFHYADIRKNDLKVGSKVAFITQHFDPNTTLIIAEDTLWRPYMYHLKEYHLINVSGLTIDEPRFVHIRRDAQNWIMKENFHSDLSILIPKGITTVVFIDDKSPQWIKKYPFQRYSLPGKSSISVMKVKPNTIMHYGYQSIVIMDGS